MLIFETKQIGLDLLKVDNVERVQYVEVRQLHKREHHHLGVGGEHDSEQARDDDDLQSVDQSPQILQQSCKDDTQDDA